MRKVYFLLLTILLAVTSRAQVANYTATTSSGTYTAIAGGTVLATGAWDDSGPGIAIPIGFSFVYNGTSYTTCNINLNGYISFGTGTTTTTYTPISTFNAGEVGTISGFGRDLQGTLTTGEIRYQSSGGVFTVQWTNAKRYNAGTATTESFNFQIQLVQTTNVINIVYGTFANASATGAPDATLPQVGLRGASTADFKNFSVLAAGNWAAPTPGAANTATCYYNEATVATKPASGQTYTFTPPPPCVVPAGQATSLVLTPFPVQINGSFTTTTADGYLVVRYPTGSSVTSPVNGTTYTVGNSLGLGTVISTSASSTFSATGLTPSTTYDFYVYAYNFACLGGPLYNTSSPASGTQSTLAPANIVSTGAGGLWSQPSTWVGGVVPDGGDNATIVNGATVTIDMNPTVTNLTVGGGASGILEYEQTTARTLTVLSSAVVAAGGTFRSNAAGTVTTHSLSLAGNLTNNGTIDFSTNANTAGARLTFTGASDANFDCSGATLTDLQQTSGLTLNKGTSSATLLNFTPGAGGTHTVLGANTAGFLTITNGTFKINGTNTFNNPVFNAAAYSVPSTGGIWLNNANATIASQNGSPTMSGLLRMTSGTFNVGNTAGNNMGGATTSNFVIEGGTMNFGSRLNVTSAGAIFNMSNGVINVCTVGNATSATASFGFTSTTSVFTMSGGTINLVQRSTGATILDYNVATTAPTITGGTLNVGTGATATNFDFRIQGATPSLVIDNTGNAKTAVLSANTNVFGNITITTGASLNHNATTGFFLQVLGNLTSAGNVVNNGSIVGTAAGSRFDFVGNGSAQTYSGTGTFGTAGTPFVGLGVGIANTSNVTLSAPIVTTRVNLFRGTFINSNQITVGSGAALACTIQRGGGSAAAGSFDVAPVFNLGTGALGLIYSAATTNTTTGFEIPATRSVTTCTINSTPGATLAGGNLSIATTLTLTLGKFTTSAGNVPTVLNSAVGGVAGFSNVSYVVGPLARTFAASLAGASTYDFPVGTATTYNNIQMQPTTTASASLAVVQWQAVAGATGGTPDGATINVLNSDKYWAGAINANAASFTSTIYRITDGGFSANSRMARSATLMGVYAAISPAPAASVLVSTAQTTVDFIAIGQVGTLISGIKTVCASGCDYTSLTAAGGAFADINSKIVNGNIDLQIAGDISIEDGVNSLNEFTSPYTITIRPTGAARSVSGTSTGGLIKLNGADRVTIDGSLTATPNSVCPAVSASRDLTITNNNAGTSSAVIWLQTITTGPNPATNNTVMNCNIVGSGPAATLVGIGSGSSTVSITGLGNGNNNNSFINNNISKTQFGIYSMGASVTNKNQGTIINQNLINTAVPNNVGVGGILTGFENNLTISGNRISEIINAGSTDIFAISAGYASNGFAVTSTGANECTNVTITKNVIGSIVQTGTFSSIGIGMGQTSGTVNTGGTNLIADNMISGVSSNGTSPDFSSGIYLGNTYGSLTRVYYNTVAMQGTIGGATAATILSSSFSHLASFIPDANTLDIRNNIFTNSQLGNAGATLRITSITTNLTAAQYANIVSNNNDYYATGAGPGTYAIGQLGSMTAGTLSTTLANWQAATGKDALTKNVLPVFVSATDLHLSTAAASNWCLNNTGVAVSVTDDIDCQVRNNPPDIGADEFVATSTDIATPASQTICTGNAITTIVLSGGATSYSWTRDNTGTVTGIAASGTGNISGSLTNTTASPVTVTFTITPLDAFGCSAPANITATVTVNPNNTITLTSAPATTSQTVCINTPIVNITYATTGATGATFSGLPAGVTGNWAANVVTISGTPTASGSFSYTVNLTGGCGTISATGSINVTPNNTIVRTSAAGTDAQTLCLNDPLVNITYLVSGASGVNVTGLPAGVTSNFVANVLTISGTPTATGTFNYNIALIGGCGSASANGSITINARPVIGSSVTQPTTCVSADGAIDLTITGAVGPFTYTWSTSGGSGLTPGVEDQTGLTVGQYTVVVTAPNGCQASMTFNLPGPGGCSICPTIGSLTTSPTPAVCTGLPVTMNATGLTFMGVTYGITFKVSTSALADPYVGGTVVATIPNGSLGGGGTTASTTTSSLTAGNYIVYAILSPTPIDPSCRPFQQVNLTVNQTPNAVATPSSQTICSGSAITTIVLSGSTGGTTFNWTRDNTGTVTGIGANGSGDISGALTNTTNAPITVTFTITPSTANCTGAPITATVVVNPTPNAVATPSSQTICSGATITTIALTGAVSGTSYAWTRNNTGTVTGIGANGTGNISGALTNTTSAPITVTFTITPTANGCPGTPITATVLVNPTPNAVATPSSQTICSGGTITTIALTGAVSGTSYAWTRDNTGTVTGIGANGTGNISGALTNTTNAPITVTFTITPTANGCPGTPITATVLVNPTPNAVATPSSQTVCSGSPITTIALTSAVTGTTYSWTRNNTVTVTGIPANGTGNISGTLTNTTNAPITVTFTITPTANGCPGTPITATVLVNPNPTVSAGGMQVIITGSGEWADEITWTLTNASSVVVLNGGPYGFDPGPTASAVVASNNGPYTFFIEAQGAFNDNSCTWQVLCGGTVVASGCIRGTNSGSGCGSVGTLTVPNIAGCGSNLGAQTICSGSAITPITLSGPVAGTTFNWTRNNTATVTGIAASGTGNISGTLTNTTNAPVVVTFTITPVANGCNGTPVNVNVTVNPIPNAVATPSTQTVCSGPITPIVLTSAVSGTTYAWTRNNTVNVTGIAASGTGNITGTLTNTTLVQQTVIFTITPTANGCTGAPITATVILNAGATITCPANMTATSIAGTCATPVTYSPTVQGSPAPTLTYSFAGATTGSGSGSGSGSSFNVGVTTVTITATNGCGTQSCSFTITVNDAQLPTITTPPANRSACVGGNATFTVAATTQPTTGGPIAYQWQQWNGTAWVNIAGATTNTMTVTNVTLNMNTNTYRVVLTGLCSVVNSSAATLSVNPVPTVIVSANPAASILPNQTTTLTAVANPAGGTFTWTFNGAPIAGGTNGVLGPIGIDGLGNYRAIYTSPAGCTASSADFQVTGAITDILWVYPNPNRGQFQVRFYNAANEPATILVFNMQGQKVYERKVTTGAATYSQILVDLGFKANGSYIVQLVNGAGKVLGAKQIVVEVF